MLQCLRHLLVGLRDLCLSALGLVETGLDLESRLVVVVVLVSRVVVESSVSIE